jgi:hypothetical protein
MQAPTLQQETYQSVQAPNIYSQPLDNMLRVVVEQVMAEFNGALSEEDKLVSIKKCLSNLMKQMATRFHRSLNIIAINANGIWWQLYELSI